jgi:cyanophycin synthetase
VVGDGVHTLEQLVAQVNADPRRGIGHEKVLTRIVFDAQANALMTAKGYTRETVPAAGEVVYLRSTGNLSTGGTATDLTDVVHPDNVEMAVRAVKAIGLDIGGVDFLTRDITMSYKDVGGAICEINAAPGFRMHMAPSEGRARDVAARTARRRRRAWSRTSTSSPGTTWASPPPTASTSTGRAPSRAT